VADDRTLFDKFVDDLMEDPGQAAVKVDRLVNMIVDLTPTMPDEFPIPIPNVLYRKLNLERFFKRE